MNDAERILREKYHGERSEEYEDDLVRLERGEPIGYIIGHVPFINATIDVSHKPLLPRVETEFWVNEVIKDIQSDDSAKLKVLDLFSGSGCIGVATLKDTTNTHVTFGEVDVSMINQIKTNISMNDVDQSRTIVIETNVFSNITDKYDLILANPPYVPVNRKLQLDKSVTDYEPSLAVFVPGDGSGLINECIADAPKYLKPGGSIYIEIDTSQSEQLVKLAKAQSTWSNVTILKDQYDRPRVLHLQKA